MCAGGVRRSVARRQRRGARAARGFGRSRSEAQVERDGSRYRARDEPHRNAKCLSGTAPATRIERGRSRYSILGYSLSNARNKILHKSRILFIIDSD